MVVQENVVTCERCGSTDIIAEEEYYNHQYRKVKGITMPGEYHCLKSVDIKLVCHCNVCGNNFEKFLRTNIYDVLPDETEV